MKLGMFMMPLHPPQKDRTVCFDEDIEQVVRAEALGFTEAWIGQHHTVAWEPIPSNDLFIATLIPRTTSIRLGTGVSIIPHHHPVNVAVRLAFLDHLSRGRINAGFGQSGVPTDWGLFDLPDPGTQGLMTMEGMELVMKLWQADAPFDFRGKFWHVHAGDPDLELGVGVMLKPYQQPHPPIGMSVIKAGSMAARTAGERGFLPISTNLVPESTLASHWETYCEGAAEAQRLTPERELWRISRSIFVADSDAEAWDHARGGTFAASLEYLIRILTAGGVLYVMKEHPDQPDAEITVDYAMEKLCIVGSVQTCIERLRALREATGGFGTLLMIAHDWDDRARWTRSLELLAREVVPAVAAHGD